MKILFFNPTGILGGAERNLLDVLTSLRTARPDWRLRLLLGDEGPLRNAVEALGIPCDTLPLPHTVARLGDAGLSGLSGRVRLAARTPAAAVATAGYVKRLRTRLRAEAPDRVVTNGMKAHVLGAWTAPRGVPVLWNLQDFVRSRPIMAHLLRASSGRNITVVALSLAVAADVAQTLGHDAEITTIHSAIDLDQFAPGPGQGSALDQASGLPPAPPGTVRVGLVSTFARWKGHDVFLEAAAQIPPDRPCRFYVVGGPIYRSAGSQYSVEELRDKAEALGLSGRIGFTGHQADPVAALRALDVVVHASTRPEPFGRVIVEGMACGRAVVAMRDGGAAELFQDDVTALGCRPGRPDELAQAITRLVDDPTLRSRLGAAGREAALARFNRTRLAGEWLPLLEAGPPTVGATDA
ncbi:MAG: glycosyltransferase [Isosphaeraceae bacterium]|nr:glycosyltransferase [Isosphaeraceae bacterium]